MALNQILREFFSKYHNLLTYNKYNTFYEMLTNIGGLDRFLFAEEGDTALRLALIITFNFNASVVVGFILNM